MKKDKNAQKKIGAQAFEEYYSQIYGDRWASLRQSLFAENSPVEFRVPGSEKSYFLDSASVFAALCLPLEGAERILDLCAAPGGKTLVLASRMSATAKLFSNERSPDRKRRLATVVAECLPPEISARVTTSCSDGATWCRRESESYDAILLDAPCSSERHVILDPKYLNVWTPNRIKTVTTEQWALLSSAFRLLSPGGFLLYSTCALCPAENDGMIERLFKKFPGTFELAAPAPCKAPTDSPDQDAASPHQSAASPFQAPDAPGQACDLSKQAAASQRQAAASPFHAPQSEKTQYGYQILPDRQGGAGPIYFSLIKKTASLKDSSEK